MFNPAYSFKNYILETLDLLTIQSCESWVKRIKSENNVCAVLRDKRGRYKRVLFYETFPEIEKQARMYAIESASLKECSFTVNDLATYITLIFKYQYTELFDRYLIFKLKKYLITIINLIFVLFKQVWSIKKLA